MSESVAEIFESMEYGPAPESPAEAEAWLEARGRRLLHYIGGAFVAPGADRWLESTNPADGRHLVRFAHGDAADVDAAARAAREAFGSWRKTPGHERARYLYALARLVQRHARLFAVLESLDNGKPIREARDSDIPLVARHFYHHAGWAQLCDSEFPGLVPHGVAGQIIPWNFPLLMLAWKIAPALAAGNTVVLKPAEQTPITAILFAELCREAGLPAGVVNIVLGDGETGEAITTHPQIDKLAFTGSTDVGRRIREASAGSGKALTLELGGKSPFIVFEDADLDAAVEGVVEAIWFNQGEVCCGGSRILVQESVEADFTARLKRRMENLRMGDPLDKAVDIGAIIDTTQQARIQRLVAAGEAEGAVLHTPSWPCPEGCYYPPTLATGVEPASTLATEEIFGPVVVSMPFRTPEDAAALANNTRYGLAASVWSENINQALDLAPRLKAGVVWVNSTNLFDAACGFGGYRESGYGREGGREGMMAYLRPACHDRLKPARPAADAPAEIAPPREGAAVAHIDRTAKLYIGGRQTRPDGNYALPVADAEGRLAGEVGHGNRKDIRDAVEAADKAAGWANRAHHERAQILFYMAENLDVRRAEFIERLRALTGAKPRMAERETDLAIQRLFSYGAWCDKYDGAVHAPPTRAIAVAMNEPLGNIGIICPDEAPLLGFVSLTAPAIAMGNRVVAVPSERAPLLATDFYQVLETSDLPGGVLNIVTGRRAELLPHLAGHDNLDGMWYFGPDREGAAETERLSVSNLKRTWTACGLARDWTDPEQAEGREFLAAATQIKNVWVPYGEG